MPIKGIYTSIGLYAGSATPDLFRTRNVPICVSGWSGRSAGGFEFLYED